MYDSERDTVETSKKQSEGVKIVEDKARNPLSTRRSVRGQGPPDKVRADARTSFELLRASRTVRRDVELVPSERRKREKREV